MSSLLWFCFLLYVMCGSATHCNTLQHTATCCNAQSPAVECPVYDLAFDILQHSAALQQARPCSWMPSVQPCFQNTATHCNILQHTATRKGMQLNAQCTTLLSTLQHTAIHCNTQQYTATHSNTLQNTAIPRVVQSSAQCTTVLSHAATHCNILQHTATHMVIQLNAYCTNCTILLLMLQHTAIYCNTLQHTESSVRLGFWNTAAHFNILKCSATNRVMQLNA